MNIPDDAFFTLLEQALRGKGSETLQRTLYQQLREAILQGTLAGDSRLPGSRAMAQHLGLSRNTINELTNPRIGIFAQRLRTPVRHHLFVRHDICEVRDAEHLRHIMRNHDTGDTQGAIEFRNQLHQHPHRNGVLPDKGLIEHD